MKQINSLHIMRLLISFVILRSVVFSLPATGHGSLSDYTIIASVGAAGETVSIPSEVEEGDLLFLSAGRVATTPFEEVPNGWETWARIQSGNSPNTKSGVFAARYFRSTDANEVTIPGVTHINLTVIRGARIDTIYTSQHDGQVGPTMTMSSAVPETFFEERRLFAVIMSVNGYYLDELTAMPGFSTFHYKEMRDNVHITVGDAGIVTERPDLTAQYGDRESNIPRCISAIVVLSPQGTPYLPEAPATVDTAPDHSYDLTATVNFRMSQYFDGKIDYFTATGLPSGLAVERFTGRIYGFPEQQGTSTVEVTAHNEIGDAKQTFTLTVGAAHNSEVITVSNVTDLRNAIINQPAGSVILIAPGTYTRLANQIQNIHKRTAGGTPTRVMAKDWNNKPVFTDARNVSVGGGVFYFQGCSGIELHGIDFIPNNETRTVYLCTIKDGSQYSGETAGSIIYTGPDASTGISYQASKSDHMGVYGCTFRGTRQQIATSNCSHLTLAYNNHDNMGMDAVRYFLNSGEEGHMENFAMEHCWFGGHVMAIDEAEHVDYYQGANNGSHGQRGVVLRRNVIEQSPPKWLPASWSFTNQSLFYFSETALWGTGTFSYPKSMFYDVAMYYNDITSSTDAGTVFCTTIRGFSVRNRFRRTTNANSSPTVKIYNDTGLSLNEQIMVRDNTAVSTLTFATGNTHITNPIKIAQKPRLSSYIQNPVITEDGVPNRWVEPVVGPENYPSNYPAADFTQNPSTAAANTGDDSELWENYNYGYTSIVNPEQNTLTTTINAVLYPNPVERGQTLYVEVDADEEELLDATIDVYDLLGVKIINQPVSGKIPSDNPSTVTATSPESFIAI